MELLPGCWVALDSKIIFSSRRSSFCTCRRLMRSLRSRTSSLRFWISLSLFLKCYEMMEMLTFWMLSLLTCRQSAPSRQFPSSLHSPPLVSLWRDYHAPQSSRNSCHRSCNRARVNRSSYQNEQTSNDNELTDSCRWYDAVEFDLLVADNDDDVEALEDDEAATTEVEILSSFLLKWYKLMRNSIII